VLYFWVISFWFYWDRAGTCLVLGSFWRWRDVWCVCVRVGLLNLIDSWLPNNRIEWDKYSSIYYETEINLNRRFLECKFILIISKLYTVKLMLKAICLIRHPSTNSNQSLSIYYTTYLIINKHSQWDKYK